MKEKDFLIAIPLLIGIYFLIKPKKAGQEQRQINRDIRQEGSPNYSNSQFIIWANRLEQAMFDIGTDETAIYSIFNYMKNNADFLTLNKTFGLRTYTGGYLPAFLNAKLNLSQWIQEELNSREIQKLNDILKKNNITYRF
jgi:hypothetical protein